MGRRMLFCSGKGGVGKSTVVANLAFALSAAGKSVICIDADSALNNLDSFFCLENEIKYSINDVTTGRTFLSAALNGSKRYNAQNCGGYGTKPGLSTDGKIEVLSTLDSKLEPLPFREIVYECANIADFVLVDAPAGLNEQLDICMSAVKEVFVVTTPNLNAIRDADKTVSRAVQFNLSAVSLIVNRVRGDLISQNKAATPEEISRLLKVPLIGVLPEDDNILIGGAVNPKIKGKSSYAYSYLAGFIAEGICEIYDCASGGGIIGKIINRFI